MSTVANSPAAWSERAVLPTPHEAAMWSPMGQQLRFQAVLRHLELEPGDTLLDYGGGHGALCALLPPHVGYWGYDWSEAMVAACGRNQPRAEAVTELPDMLFDHVVAVGTFNLADGWWKQRTWDTLAELWAENVRRTLAVALYRGTDPTCLTYSALDAYAFATGMGCASYVIAADYLPNDLLLVMRR
jgi:hypothetical protein